MRLFINFLAFQLGWFASVLGAAHGLPWAGPVVVAMVVMLHLRLVRRPLPPFPAQIPCMSRSRSRPRVREAVIQNG